MIRASYSYEYGGKREENETKGEGDVCDFGERMLDPRLGRWMSVDPLFYCYPHQSPYMASSGDPVNRVDPTGMGDYYGKDGKHLGSDGKTVKRGGRKVGDDKAYLTTQALKDTATAMTS